MKQHLHQINTKNHQKISQNHQKFKIKYAITPKNTTFVNPRPRNRHTNFDAGRPKNTFLIWTTTGSQSRLNSFEQQQIGAEKRFDKLNLHDNTQHVASYNSITEFWNKDVPIDMMEIDSFISIDIVHNSACHSQNVEVVDGFAKSLKKRKRDYLESNGHSQFEDFACSKEKVQKMETQVMDVLDSSSFCFNKEIVPCSSYLLEHVFEAKNNEKLANASMFDYNYFANSSKDLFQSSIAEADTDIVRVCLSISKSLLYASSSGKDGRFKHSCQAGLYLNYKAYKNAIRSKYIKYGLTTLQMESMEGAIELNFPFDPGIEWQLEFIQRAIVRGLLLNLVWNSKQASHVRDVTWTQGIWRVFLLIYPFEFEVDGSVLRRKKITAWKAFVPLRLLVGAYNLWDEGFLFHWEIIDYSSGYVTHFVSEIFGFKSAFWIGQRTHGGRARSPSNNILLTIAGAVLLWMGWTGFNGGTPLVTNIDLGKPSAFTNQGNKRDHLRNNNIICFSLSFSHINSSYNSTSASSFYNLGIRTLMDFLLFKFTLEVSLCSRFFIDIEKIPTYDIDQEKLKFLFCSCQTPTSIWFHCPLSNRLKVDIDQSSTSDIDQEKHEFLFCSCYNSITTYLSSLIHQVRFLHSRNYETRSDCKHELIFVVMSFLSFSESPRGLHLSSRTTLPMVGGPCLLCLVYVFLYIMYVFIKLQMLELFQG